MNDNFTKYLHNEYEASKLAVRLDIYITYLLIKTNFGQDHVPVTCHSSGL